MAAAATGALSAAAAAATGALSTVKRSFPISKVRDDDVHTTDDIH